MPDKAALEMTVPSPRVSPALSATSDMPDLNLNAPAPVVVPETTATDAKVAPETKPEVKTDAETQDKVETKPEADKAETGDKDDAWPEGTPDFVKDLVTKTRGQKRAAETRAKNAETARKTAETKADLAAANLAKALESVETLTKSEAARISKDIETQDPRPAREQYDDPNKYDDDLIAWSGRRAAMVAKAEVEKEITDKANADKTAADAERTKEENAKVAEAWVKRKEAFTESHPDFVELTESDALQISVPMAHFIMNDEDGAPVVYYLAQNPEESERISKMTPIHAVGALGRIAARLAAKPAVSTKPDPITPIKGASEAATRKTADEESMAEYGNRRQAEIARAARARLGQVN